ncbi:hypothetical protein H8E52_11930 [bacterium]|nr:hypothetical protein [bacterium]
MDCHGEDSEVVAISGQWGGSKHASGENIDRNGTDCSYCHTHEGFIHYVDTGEAIEPMNPSGIGCFTCHEPHTNEDFSLRTDDPVDLTEGGTFDFGLANLCVNCHQSRAVDPSVEDAGTRVEITNKRWGPHHGPQGNFLAGDLGYLSEGLDSSDPHQGADNGCVDCHMATVVGAWAGGHTMNMYYEETEPNVAGCNTTDCHDGGIDDGDDWAAGEGFNYGFVQSDVMDLMAELRAILLAEELIDADDYVNVPITMTLPEAEAVFYFRSVLEDRSNGVHNPDLTVDILEYSISLFP